MKERITMRSIAEQAGCSHVTVSRALRNDPGISHGTRDRIQRLARELRYLPNPLVSALMASRGAGGGDTASGTVIATVLSTLPRDQKEDRNVKEVVRGVMARAAETGFRIDEFRFGTGGLSGPALHKVLRARGIRGLILFPITLHETLDDFPFQHYAASAIGPSITAQDLSRAHGDCFGNMVLAVRRLAALGYRRPGLVIQADLDVFTDLQYHGGYLAAVDASPDLTSLQVLLLRHPKTRATLAAWFKTNRPDVVISTRGILRQLEDSGLQDVAFAAIDHLPQQTKLAGFDSQLEMLGSAAVDLVTAQLYRNEFGRPRIPKTVLIPGKWIDGPSAPPLNHPQTTASKPSSLKPPPSREA